MFGYGRYLLVKFKRVKSEYIVSESEIRHWLTVATCDTIPYSYVENRMMLHQNPEEQWDWSDPYGTPRTHNPHSKQRPILSERKLAVYGLIVSVMVITVKVFSLFSDDIARAFLEQKLLTYEVIKEDGNKMLMYTWKKVVRYSNFGTAIAFGFISGYFTWIMMYLDSHVPGLYPPSPLSPKKYKLESGHTFHLNYLFAILVGTLVFFYSYYKENLIQF